ncbi:MAG: hypothetical protein WAT79_13430 [Saprospiraceae bacterium]
MRIIIVGIIFTCFTVAMYAQIGIGTTNPNTTSILDITSTEKGILKPRLDTNQIKLIVNPAEGMLLFNIDNISFFYRNQGGWFQLHASYTGLAKMIRDFDKDIWIGTDKDSLNDNKIHIVVIENEHFQFEENINRVVKINTLNYSDNIIIGDSLTGQFLNPYRFLGKSNLIIRNEAVYVVDLDSFYNTVEYVNVAVGSGSHKNGAGIGNVGVGCKALYHNSIDRNTAVGDSTL